MNLTQLKRVLRQTLLLPILALALVAAALAWQILDAQHAVSRMQLADANIETATLLKAEIVDEETGLRAYQTTGNEIFLQPYEYAAEPLRDSIRKLHDGLQHQGADVAPLDHLRAQHLQWVRTIAEPIISSVQAGSDTRDPGLNLRAKGRMDSMLRLVDQITNDQAKRRLNAIDTWHRQLRETLIALVALTLIAGLFIGIFARNQLRLVSEAFQQTLGALRKHAQATFDSEQRLRAILIHLSEAVVVCDLDGRIELMNPAAERLVGITQKEARGRLFDDLFPLEGEITHTSAESPVAAVRRELRTITPNESFVLRRADGAELTIDESGAPVYERNGDLAGIVLVLRDSTQQRQAQAALLASEKLAVAGRLAATIAHEIHNPLDSVSNLLYLMRTGSNPEENTRFLEMAQGELSRATQISRALLGMYRESRTAVGLDIASLLSSVLVLLDGRFREIGVQIKADLEQPSVVSGFPAELRQVFTNLLVNAAEASPRGEIVEVRTRPSAGITPSDPAATRRPGVLITVEDRGSGIDPDTQRKLFQPFFSTKGEAGTGLGLWVSRGIVEKHGGTIELASSTDPEHHGTIVSVFLPRGQAEWSEAGDRNQNVQPEAFNGGPRNTTATHA